MKNLFKLILLFFVLLLLIFILTANVYGINMDLDLLDNINEDSSNNTMDLLDNTDQDSLNAIYDSDFESNTTADTSFNTADTSFNTADTSNLSNPQITITSNKDNEFLTIENILSVTIIVIGIILIFLGIAIIIRCK